MEDALKIKTTMLDFGRLIGVAVERDGERRAVKVENPFGPEIDAEWQRKHK